MRLPSSAPTNIRKPQATEAAPRLRQVPQGGGSVGTAMPVPKDMVGPKKHRSEVLHAEAKSKLWAAPTRKPPTTDELQQIGSKAIEDYISRFYATVGK